MEKEELKNVLKSTRSSLTSADTTKLWFHEVRDKGAKLRGSFGELPLSAEATKGERGTSSSDQQQEGSRKDMNTLLGPLQP